MDTLTLNSKGQVTIPAPVRKKYNLKPGTVLKLSQDVKGECLTMTKTISIRDGFGILSKPKKSFTVEEMNDSMEKAVAQHVAGE